MILHEIPVEIPWLRLHLQMELGVKRLDACFEDFAGFPPIGVSFIVAYGKIEA
jgi:hypothetical protein